MAERAFQPPPRPPPPLFPQPPRGRRSGWMVGHRRLIRKVALGLVAGMLVQSAAAQEALPLKLAVVLGGSVVWDANVFRLPGSVDPLTAVGKPNKDDRINTAYLGLRIDKSFAQQRFQLDVTKTTTRFNSFTFLDFDALDYRGAWLWHLTPRLGGTLSTDHRQTLVPFTDFRGFQRNVSNTDSRRFSLDGWLAGGWHLLLGVFDSETKYTQAFLAQTSSRSTGAEA